MENNNQLRLLQAYPFHKHAILQLILFIASMYIVLHIIVVVFLILTDAQKNTYDLLIVPNIGISDWKHFMEKPWTIITYTISHKSFFEMLSNLVWLYVFGNVIQYYTSYKEIFFYFFFMTITAGVLYLVLTMLLPNVYFPFVVNAMHVTSAFAFGALMVAPKGTQVLLGGSLGIPLWLLVLIFTILNGLFIGFENGGLWMLLIISAFVGLLYGKYLQSGARPGTAIYNRFLNVNEKFYGAEAKIDGWRLDKLASSIRSGNPGLPESEIIRLIEKVKTGGIGSLSINERGYVFKNSEK